MLQFPARERRAREQCPSPAHESGRLFAEVCPPVQSPPCL